MELTESLKWLQWHMWDLWRESARRSGSMDLTNSEFDYLYALISRREGMRLTELAACMKVSKASASAMVSKLERRGYIRRVPCPNDGRAVRLQATKKAAALEKEELDIYAAMARTLSAELDDAELAQLSRLLAKACVNLKTD